METAKRKHILYDHPFLGGLVSLVLSFLFISNFSVLPELTLQVFQDMLPESSMPAELPALVNNLGSVLTAILALVCLLIHRLWFRKDGYKGCFTRPGMQNKEAWMVVLGGLVLDIVINAVYAIFAGNMPVFPTVTTVLISLRAGIYEETVFRGIPVSIMMKNNPSRTRMWIAVVVSALVFGLIHMGNVTAGAAMNGAIVQSVNAFCLGLLFAAIYLRSGNILLTMVYHTLHDVIALTDPAQVTGVVTQSDYTAADLAILAAIAAVYAAAAFFLLRKSKWEEIKATWANIWAE